MSDQHPAAAPYRGVLTRPALAALRPLKGIERHRTYDITQLRRDFGVTGRALRFYEEAGLISPARRRGQRVYSHKDHVRLQIIVRGRAVGLTVEAIREILETYDLAGARAQAERALELFREQIERLTVRRREVEAGIAELHEAIAEREAALGG